VPLFSLHVMESFSDMSFDLTTASTVNTSGTELAEDPAWVQHLAHRCHPPMQPPSFVKGLKVDTTRSHPNRAVMTANLPRGDKKKNLPAMDSLTRTPATAKPQVKYPETVHRGWFFWWGLCGGDCTAAVAMVG
jgi:hypothetical protein